mgnify:CR=1 FL=1
MFTDPALKKEIIEKKRFIEREKAENLNFSLEQMFNEHLETEALDHSLRIEYHIPIELRDKNKSVRKAFEKEIRTAGKNLKNAWDYGKNHFNPLFDDFFLVDVAKLVDPKVEGYRADNVRVLTSMISRPDPYSLREEHLPKFFQDLKELNSKHEQNKQEKIYESCFDIGAWVHFNLARIHPFEDGNGRIARILHNLYLRNSDSFPPIILYEGERFDYYSHLENAMRGFIQRKGRKNSLVVTRDGLSKGEMEFYDFMAGKLNMALDKIIEKT